MLSNLGQKVLSETVVPGNFPWVTCCPGKLPQVTHFHHKLHLLSTDTPLNSRQQLFAYRRIVATVTGMYSDITRQVLGFLHGQLIPSTTRPSAFPYFRHLFLSKNKAFGVVAQENTNWKQAASCTGSNFSHVQKKRLKQSKHE